MSLNTTLSRTLEIETYDGRFKGDHQSNSEQVIEEMKSTRFAEADDLQAEIEDIITLHNDINERMTTSVKMRSPIIYWTNAYRILKLFTVSSKDTMALRDEKAYQFNTEAFQRFIDQIEYEIKHLEEKPSEGEDKYSEVRTILPFVNGKGPKASSPVEAEIDVLKESLKELKAEKEAAAELLERVNNLNREHNQRLAIRLYYELYSNDK